MKFDVWNLFYKGFEKVDDSIDNWASGSTVKKKRFLLGSGICYGLCAIVACVYTMASLRSVPPEYAVYIEYIYGGLCLFALLTAVIEDCMNANTSRVFWMIVGLVSIMFVMEILVKSMVTAFFACFVLLALPPLFVFFLGAYTSAGIVIGTFLATGSLTPILLVLMIIAAVFSGYTVSQW